MNSHESNDSMDRFVGMVSDFCAQNGVIYIESSGDVAVSGGLTASGSFNYKNSNYNDSPTLEVMRTDDPRWVSILAHEFCHVKQWKAGKLDMAFSLSYPSIANSWVSGDIEVEEEEIHGIIRSIQEIEWDCERETIKTIWEHRLPISIKDYSQGANAYVSFYWIYLLFRRWYHKDNKPYNIPGVYRQFSPVFKPWSYFEIPRKIPLLLTCTEPPVEKVVKSNPKGE